jgi:hypothetical protein
MRKRKQNLSIFVHILLLFAIEVQGITPDSQDLSSLKGLQLLCQLSAGLELPDDYTGSAPLESCEVLRNVMGSRLCDFIDRIAAHAFASCNHFAITVENPAAGAPAIQIGAVPSDGLTLQLCRMLC